MKNQEKEFHFRIEYVFVIVCLLLYLLLYLFVFPKKKNNENKTEPIYIVLNAEQKFAYHNGKLESSADWNEILGTKKFYSYSDGNYLGEYKLMIYNTALYLFDDNNNSIDYDGTLFTYSSPKKLELVNTRYINADEEIGEVLRTLAVENNVVVPPIDELQMSQKIPVDLDGDGNLETIYSINYLNDMQSFSFLYYKKDGKLYRIASSVGTKENQNYINFYSITQVMDLDDDNKKEIIVRNRKYGTVAVDEYMVYKKKGNDYKSITN